MSPQDRIGAAGWRIVLLASLGGTLEFYDFVIFGIFAKDIADAMFPSASPLVSLMASFAAFAAGYLARPIGGIVLSHYGDRYGRRKVFLWSVFVMSGATLGMGLVPSYAAWGVAASALMVLLRLVQGFCLGGELPGALTYVVETAPQHCAVGMRGGLRVRDDGRGGGHWRQPRRFAPSSTRRWCRSRRGASPSSWAALAACSASCCGDQWRSRRSSPA